jgi:hypothetical protein
LVVPRNSSGETSEVSRFYDRGFKVFTFTVPSSSHAFLVCMDSRKATQAPTLAPQAPTQHLCAAQLMENNQAGKHTGGYQIEAIDAVQPARHMHAEVRHEHIQPKTVGHT